MTPIVLVEDKLRQRRALLRASSWTKKEKARLVGQIEALEWVLNKEPTLDRVSIRRNP